MNPKNTVGKQVTGASRDDLAHQDRSALPEDTPDNAQPSEVSHPHAKDADHLRPFAPNAGQENSNEAANAPAGGTHGGARPGNPPRTGIGKQT